MERAEHGYATDSWKDRLTSYNGSTITYDAIGNPLTYRGYIYDREAGHSTCRADRMMRAVGIDQNYSR